MQRYLTSHLVVARLVKRAALSFTALVYCFSFVSGLAFSCGAVVCLTVLAAGCGKSADTTLDPSNQWVLIYKVDEKEAKCTPEEMDLLISVIGKRINPKSYKDVSVVPKDTNMVEITMPKITGGTPLENAAEMERIRKLICSPGTLEFRIVATRRFEQSIIELASVARKDACRKSPGTDEARIYLNSKGKETAKWCRVRTSEQERLRQDNAAIEVYDGKDQQGNEKHRVELLVMAPEAESYNVTGKHIRHVFSSMDRESGGWDVGFALDQEGERRFGRLTSEHTPIDDFKWKLAIVVDDVVQAAPVLFSMITDHARITGDFTKIEVEDLCEIINDGGLPVKLEKTPVRDSSVDQTAPKGSTSASAKPQHDPQVAEHSLENTP
jgi:preprotein translocase subunit SecD